MSSRRPVRISIANAIFIAAALLAVRPAAAEEKPLWEAGLGIGALRFPDYRGSDESQVYPVPVPYFVYRGDFFKADRDGVRGELFNRRYVEFNISLNATIPVNSDDNAARRGMPDLKPTIEIGPSLDLHLWRSASENVKLDLVMPVRAPITVESSPQSIGWVFSPRLNVDFQDIGHRGWDFGFGAGPIVADRKFHDYFYSVAPRFATAERTAYQADGGYSGMHVLTSLSKRFSGYWVGAYLRYDTLSGAVFEDSPLVRSRSYWAGGVGIAWMIGQSKRMVASAD
ncbi:MAG TPA: MipA/OmpV family protein [Povalibacter sp.]|nr:MipA/OmpV family protein [Povalibacter sp.]